MLVHFLQRALAASPWTFESHPLARITPRAAAAAMASFLLALVLGPVLIAWLERRFREPIKMPIAALAKLHATKAATPTMGGLFVVAALVASGLLLADGSNAYVPIALVLAVALAALGACDDWVKLSTTRRGLSAKTKLVAQTVIAAATAMLVLHAQGDDSAPIEMAIPFVGHIAVSSWFFIPWAMLVIVGSSNAVNLADGLDGLAGGCMLAAAAALAIVVYASGHAQWAAYLNIPHVPGAGETAVLAAAMIGALLGFLWFNCHPASVFLGDAGSLPLGGLMGLLAVIARQELLLVAIGGVFVVEAMSVIVQVASYRLRGQRVFLCAPLHHHFQLKGWGEDKIVVRFWIAAALCAVVGLAGLKAPDRSTSEFSQLTQREEGASFATTDAKTGEFLPNYR